jgi:hypothetical protein
MRRWILVACACVVLSTAWPTCHAVRSENGRVGLVPAVVQWGRMRYDKQTRLVMDLSGRPNTVDASIGFAAAALDPSAVDVSAADRQLGRDVLDAILASQDLQPGSKTRGEFPWVVGPTVTPSQDAGLYIAPLLAYLHVNGGAEQLGAELDARVVAALRASAEAMLRLAPDPQDSTTRLMRAGALAAIGRALADGGTVAKAVAAVGEWERGVRAHGLPDGHSPTYDALKIAAVRWARWGAGANAAAGGAEQAALAEAAETLWLDFAQRVDASGAYLAGAMHRASAPDYYSGASVASYLVHYDLLGDAPPALDPLAMYILVPPAPEVTAASGRPQAPYMVTTASDEPSPVERTDTYVASEFSLGTLSGHDGGSGIITFVTYSQSATPGTSYFYLQGADGHVSSVQSGGTALVSVDFDRLGSLTRRQAWVDGIIGRRDQIEQVLLFSEDWPGMEVGVGEMGALAVKTRGCYLGVRLLHCGPALATQTTEGAKPGILSWLGAGPDGLLRLRIYARQETGPARPLLDNVRATFLVQVAPVSAFPSLADFSKALSRAPIRQTVEQTKKRVDKEQNTDKPPMLTSGKPKAKSEFVYEYSILHRISYAVEAHDLSLTEEMIGGRVVSRTVNGKPDEAPGPWTSPLLKVAWPGTKG